MELFVRPDGQVQALYDETLPLGELGILVVHRASHVEPSPAGGWKVDLGPMAGPVLGPFGARSEALEAERHWVTYHTLMAPVSQKDESLEKKVVLNAENTFGGGSCLPGADAHRQLRYAHHNRPRNAATAGRLGTWTSGFSLMAAVLIVAVAGVSWLLHKAGKPQPTPPPIMEQIQQLQELVTHRVLVSEIHETRVAGSTGGVIVTVVVHGDVLVGVDLQRARILRVDDARREIEIALPLPGTTSPRLDHDHTYVQHVAWTGLWRLVPGTATQAIVVDRALREAQASIRMAGSDPNVLQGAEIRTEGLIDALGKNVGWIVRICWSRSL